MEAPILDRAAAERQGQDSSSPDFCGDKFRVPWATSDEDYSFAAGDLFPFGRGSRGVRLGNGPGSVSTMNVGHARHILKKGQLKRAIHECEGNAALLDHELQVYTCRDGDISHDFKADFLEMF